MQTKHHEAHMQAKHLAEYQRKQQDLAHFGDDELEQLQGYTANRKTVQRSYLARRGIDPDKLTQIPHN